MIGNIFLFNNMSKEIISSCIFTNCSQLWHLSSIPIKCNLPERLHNVSVFKMCEASVKVPPPLPQVSYSAGMGPAWSKQTHQIVMALPNPIYHKNKMTNCWEVSLILFTEIQSKDLESFGLFDLRYPNKKYALMHDKPIIHLVTEIKKGRNISSSTLFWWDLGPLIQQLLNSSTSEIIHGNPWRSFHCALAT